jgi:hypothetical protein
MTLGCNPLLLAQGFMRVTDVHAIALGVMMIVLSFVKKQSTSIVCGNPKHCAVIRQSAAYFHSSADSRIFVW